MPIRTTGERVCRTAGVLPTSTDVDIFIETASTWIDGRLLEIADISGSENPCKMNDAELEILERYLAAHLYLVAFPPKREEKVDGAEKKFEGRVETRLDLTRPGQQLLYLDRCRLFVAVRLVFQWIGTER